MPTELRGRFEQAGIAENEIRDFLLKSNPTLAENTILNYFMVIDELDYTREAVSNLYPQRLVYYHWFQGR